MRIKQSAKLDVLSRFREGECNILIATDVSARGLDIPNVNYVVNYDLPEKAENYVHRVGRTGRGAHKGIAILSAAKRRRRVFNKFSSS